MSHLSVTQVFPWSFREATDNPCVHGTFRGTSATAVSALGVLITAQLSKSLIMPRWKSVCNSSK